MSEWRTNRRTRGIFRADPQSFYSNYNNIVNGKDTIRPELWIGKSSEEISNALGSAYSVEGDSNDQTWTRSIGGRLTDGFHIQYTNGIVSSAEYINYQRGPTAPREVRKDTRTQGQKISQLLKKYPATGAEEPRVFTTSKKGTNPAEARGLLDDEDSEEGGAGLDIVGDADETGDILGEESEKEEVFGSDESREDKGLLDE